MVEGGHRTRLRDLKDQLLCLWGAPLPPYIKEQGGGSRPRGEARHRGESYSHREEDSSFPCGSRRREGGRRKKEGCAPLP